ncbi:hypothetical protein, partial [uncultured Enorma sp.]|uniref:hypothetical protein n=1 Tax=uncultured Enorma sp. TaxID=1714346 RepID=UPI00261D27CC
YISSIVSPPATVSRSASLIVLVFSSGFAMAAFFLVEDFVRLEYSNERFQASLDGVNEDIAGMNADGNIVCFRTTHYHSAILLQ